MRVVLFALLAGCWTTVPPATTPPPSSATVSDSRPYADSYQHQRAPSSTRGAIPRRSVWSGTYICTQGLTAVTLTLELATSGEVNALVEFGPVPSNPTVPEGSYQMTGHVMATGPRSFTGELEPGEWVKRPPTYQSLPIAIEANDRDMIGVLKSPHCRDFKVTRIE